MSKAKRPKKTKVKPVPYEIERNLCLSTGHIPKGDVIKLDTDAEYCNATGDPTPPPYEDHLLVYKYAEGWFIYVPTDGTLSTVMDEAKKLGYSEALQNLMTLTAKQKCKFLHLDADGPQITRLPRFSW